ncbi:taste receptor type 2 member 38 [Monodelphis domestica]|uniref:Taste receptor type 2 n=1 Tax=Monodelphis domestica TaxID=13616 RepID=Q2AB89_MONDO|nr:taste receptor type 2 member 38 [Monodelphis domestica]BAE80378.1 bitter taste receptor [Monodelphis domestica]
MAPLALAITVSYEAKWIYFSLSILELAIGILSNAFIVLVNAWDLVRRHQLSKFDSVLLCLGASRIFLQILLFMDALHLTHFQVMRDPLSIKYKTVILFGMLVNQTSLWLATWLSILYCAKIARVSHAFLIWLKGWLLMTIPQLLLGSLIFPWLSFFPCIWKHFSLSYSNSTVSFSGNITENSIKERFIFFHFFLLCNLGNIFPFLLFLASSSILIISLGRHMRTMTAQTTGSGDPSLEAHIIALRSLISFLLLYVIGFVATLAAVPFTLLISSKIGVMVCVGIMLTSPSVHSIILILSNNKLKRVLKSILYWLRYFLKACIV